MTVQFEPDTRYQFFAQVVPHIDDVKTIKMSLCISRSVGYYVIKGLQESALNPLFYSERNPSNVSVVSLLKYINHIESLDVSRFPPPKPQDLPLLAKFTHLRALGVSGAQLGDGVNQLFDMTQLRALNLGNNNITNIGGIEKLTDLDFLDLSDNSLSTITPLIGLTKLRALSLKKCGVAGHGLQLLSYLSEITILDLSHNLALRSGFHNISRLTTLTQLNLSFSRLDDCEPLQKLTRLTRLSITGNNLDSFQGLITLTRLVRLEAGRNKRERWPLRPPVFSVLNHFTQLSYLNIRELSARDSHIEGLVLFTRLRTLNIGWNKLTDRGMGIVISVNSLFNLWIDPSNLTNEITPQMTRLTNLRILTVDADSIGITEAYSNGATNLQRLPLLMPNTDICVESFT